MSLGPVLLKAQTIVGHRAGPHLLITGGVHGDEFEPMVAIRRLITLIDPVALSGRLTLVPVVNEAAFAHGTRVAEDGLDLARTCPGHVDGSITEQTAYALSELIRSADFYIDLHTGGTTFSVWPMSGYMLHLDSAVLDQQRMMARAFDLPVIWGTDYRLEGRSMSVARDANVPAIYAEYLGGGRCSREGVAAYVDGCLNVLATLEMLERDQPSSKVEFEVEDPRPNSGHMQQCYPAPADGFFEVEVELGQPIKSGERLGQIFDQIGREPHAILATESGRILVLRTFPAVHKGDSLAVILPIPETSDRGKGYAAGATKHR